MRNRLGTIHELHSAIHRAFREADIEIAVPKPDIRITTAEENVSVSGR
jgi:small-conductance mechanosensitive channel